MSRVSELQYNRSTSHDLQATDQQNWTYPSTSSGYESQFRDADSPERHICNNMDVENDSMYVIQLEREFAEDGRNSPKDDQQSENPFPLFRLPTDTLLRVFSFLEKNEQLRVSAVCKYWRHLIFSSACLWRKRQLTLRCTRQSGSSRNAFFYARRLGRYLHKLSISCEHPSNHACRTMSLSFRRLMTGLRVPASLRSFKVKDLRLSQARASVLLDISSSLERLIYSLQHLKCFQMTNAHWPAQEGLRVMNSVLTSCQNSLHTLRIDGFFVPRFVPPRALDVLTPGLACLASLRKLSIDYSYLNDQTVLALATGHHVQLRSLKLVATDVSPNLRFVTRPAWLTLTRSCPSMRVEFVVQGFTTSPSVSLPLLLCPVLRVYKLCLNIGNNYTYLDTPRLNMAAVLSHVTRHFRRRLTRFELDVDNHNDKLDLALIRLVKKSRHLTSVKVKAFFNHPDTDLTLRQILRERRDKQAIRDSGRCAPYRNVTNRDTASGAITTTEEVGHASRGVSSDGSSGGLPMVQQGADSPHVVAPDDVGVLEQRGSEEVVTVSLSDFAPATRGTNGGGGRMQSSYELRSRTLSQDSRDEGNMPSTSRGSNVSQF